MRYLVVIQDEVWAVLCLIPNKMQDMNRIAETRVYICLLHGYASIFFSSRMKHTAIIQHHHQRPWFPSETPVCSGRLWWLWRNLVPSDREVKTTRRVAYVPPLRCGDVYASSERHVCYTLRRGCSNAEALYTMPGDVDAFRRPSATFYLSPYCYISDAALSP